MIYFLSFIIVLGIPVFLHELGHFLAAKSVGIKVEKFYVGFNFFGLGISKKYKDTEYGFGLFPLGGYVKVSGILDENLDSQIENKPYEFKSKNVFQKVWFLSAGVIMNFLLSTLVFIYFSYTEGYKEIINEPVIDKVIQFLSDDEQLLSPAYSLGLKSNDRITSINNLTVDSFNDMQNIITSNPNKEIGINWIREGVEYKGVITPQSITKFLDGELVDIGVIGIAPYFNTIETTFIESVIFGIKQTVSWLDYMISSLGALIKGNVSFDQLSGPLQIAKIAGDTAEGGGFKALFMLMAIISINLGLINILPFPALDGGHAAIAIIESIYRKELPIKIKYTIQLLGFILFMFLFIFIFINDIKNIL